MISLTKTQLKALAYLLDNKEKLCGIRELAKEIDVVYYLVQRNIHQLEERGVVNLQKAGKTSVIRINEQADSSYLVEAENFKREQFYKTYPYVKVVLKKIVQQAQTPFFILMIFGSYTKKPRKDSDLDVLAIVPEKQGEALEKAISSVAKTTTLSIHEAVFEENEFLSMIQKKELNVGLEAMEKHILIYGCENYYKLVR